MSQYTLPGHAVSALRRIHLSESERIVPSHLGFFLMWFGIAELTLTEMLAYVLGQQDMGRFELLVRGMDARVKCERLRKACKKYRPMGPGLSKAVAYLEQESIPLRNKLAHCWPVVQGGPGDPLIHLSTVGKLPSGHPLLRNTETAETLHMDDLFRAGLWLNEFSNVIIAVISAAVDGKPLEITDPTFHLPKEPR